MSSSSLQDESSFLQWQQVAITLAAAISSVLSLTGSGVIAYMAAQRRYSVKYRLLLALSVADIINSTVFLLWPLPIPVDTPGVWGAVGNRQTCNMQGFFLQLGILGSFYNAALSGYFMLTLCDRMTEKQITQRYELVTHAFSILWSAGTAAVALWPLDLYSVCALGCWIAPEPLRCHHRDGVECVRNNRAYMYVWLFTGIPLLLCLAFIMVTMVRIYYTVKAVSQRADRITFSASVERLAVPTTTDNTKNNNKSNNIDINGNGNGSGDTADKTKNKTVQQKSRYAIRVQETAMQALLYVAAYIVTHLFAFLCVIIEQAGGTNPFFYDLSGKFNVAPARIF
uniref:G-protein coupled receptors family 1 profile domain-containing protein n=1 Tax=Amphora coffeiformis TaxID=265554 RepID=A0A7S3PAJ0_9STRA|mmetsp:Transcript_3472/g.6901  ORF Transcript_3472/g.6901 Transcript_3472/m.6901 type:complete len:340 (+) Transcript_3472:45-1064(+)